MSLIVTVDLDWACEPAIEETLDFLEGCGIKPVVFTTHRSPCVEERLHRLEVGLHPYFAPDSSQGSTIAEVVSYVMDLPHNFPAFRCHRFASCNASKQAMLEAGIKISSNICTDLETISPFRDRFGFLEVPIFLEDGGYLYRKHPLEVSEHLRQALGKPGLKVITIHPMHFAINTPNFAYMHQIKQSLNRNEWNSLTKKKLKDLVWSGRGIKNLLMELSVTITDRTSFAALHDGEISF